jgi:hypothetical protein
MTLLQITTKVYRLSRQATPIEIQTKAYDLLELDRNSVNFLLAQIESPDADDLGISFSHDIKIISEG